MGFIAVQRQPEVVIRAYRRLVAPPEAQSVAPSTVTASFTVLAPTVVKGVVTATPTATSAAFSVLTPSVTFTNITLTPAAVTAAFTVPDPVVSRGTITIAPSAVSASFIVANPTELITNITATPSAVTAVMSIAAPFAFGSGVPSPVPASFTVLTPVISGGLATVTPAAVTVAMSTLPCVLSGGLTFTPAQVTADFTVPDPRTKQIATVSAITASFTVLTPTVVTAGGSLLFPSPVIASFSIGLPSVSVGYVITASLTTATGAVMVRRGGVLYQLVRIKQGDLFPDVVTTVKDENGVVIDLTGSSCTFSMRHSRSPATRPVADQIGSLIDGALGKLGYAWQVGETDAPGTYEAEFQVDPPVGDTFRVPTDGYIIVVVEPKV